MEPRAATAGAGPPLAPPPRVPRSAWLLGRLWPRLTPLPPRRVPTLQATPLVRPTPRMPWARSMRRSRPAVPYPVSPGRLTTTVAIRGSSRPMARMVSTTVWCLRPEVAHVCAARAPHERHTEDLLDHLVSKKCQRTLCSLATRELCRVGRRLPAALRILSWRPRHTKGEA